MKPGISNYAIVLAAAILAAGCTDKTLVPVDASRDSPANAVDLAAGFQSCGGSVEAMGATPYGAFNGTTASASYGACETVGVTIGDEAAQLVLSFTVLLQPHDGGTVASGTGTVIAQLADGHGQTARTLGSTTASADDLQARELLDAGAFDGGGPGEVAGTFQLSQDGFSIAGTFSSPYCRVTLVPALCSD